jgi:hypothetical protein
MSQDILFYLFYAFRYALGRKTYAVNDVVTEIKLRAKDIQPSTRDLMIKEIYEKGAIDDTDAAISNLWREAVEALNAV